MIIVLNEWMFHDLWGENGEEKQKQAEQFLRAFQDTSDQLVVPAPGQHRWLDKVYELMERSHLDSRLRLISRFFRSLIENSERAFRMQPEDTIAVPCEMLVQLPEEDVYLVSAHLSSNADVLVTTDHELYESLVDSGLVACELRDEFLAHYLP